MSFTEGDDRRPQVRGMAAVSALAMDLRQGTSGEDGGTWQGELGLGLLLEQCAARAKEKANPVPSSPLSGPLLEPEPEIEAMDLLDFYKDEDTSGHYSCIMDDEQPQPQPQRCLEPPEPPGATTASDSEDAVSAVALAKERRVRRTQSLEDDTTTDTVPLEPSTPERTPERSRSATLPPYPH